MLVHEIGGDEGRRTVSPINRMHEHALAARLCSSNHPYDVLEIGDQILLLQTIQYRNTEVHIFVSGPKHTNANLALVLDANGHRKSGMRSLARTQARAFDTINAGKFPRFIGTIRMG